jgi:hypothetical protein
MITQDLDIAPLAPAYAGSSPGKWDRSRGFRGYDTTGRPAAGLNPEQRAAGRPKCHGQAPPAGFSDISPIRRRAVPTLASKRPTGDRTPSAPKVVAEQRTRFKKLAGGFAPAIIPIERRNQPPSKTLALSS